MKLVIRAFLCACGRAQRWALPWNMQVPPRCYGPGCHHRPQAVQP